MKLRERLKLYIAKYNINGFSILFTYTYYMFNRRKQGTKPKSINSEKLVIVLGDCGYLAI